MKKLPKNLLSILKEQGVKYLNTKVDEIINLKEEIDILREEVNRKKSNEKNQKLRKIQENRLAD